MTGFAFALGAAVASLASWVGHRHRKSHREIVVLDDFERNDHGGVTLVTHVACASCGERDEQTVKDELLARGLEDLRRAQGGQR